MSSISSIMTVSSGGGGTMNGLVFLQTQTGSNVTSVQFTTGITGTYNNYLLIGDNITTPAATGSDNLIIQISIDGGATYFSTGYVTTGPTTGFLVLQNIDTTTFASFQTLLSNMTSGSNYPLAQTSAVWYDSASVFVEAQNTFPSAYTTPATTVNAIQVVMDDGTIFSGNFHLYGYVQ